MRRKWKKVLATTLITAMVAVSFMGCGSDSAEETSDASTDTAEATTEEAEESTGGDKVITFWNAATSEVDKAVYDAVVEMWNETNDTGYTIEMTSIANDVYKEKITIAMSSGECPDIYTHWSGGPMNEYIESGFAQPIGDLMAGTEAIDKILDGALAQASYQDELYAVPLTDTSVAGIFYNTEMFEEFGLEVPTTVAELEAVCDTLVDNGIVPFTLANANKWTGSMVFMNLATRYGGLEPFAAAVDGSGTFEDECFVYAGEKIQEWVEKGYFPEGVNSMDEDLGQSRQLLYTEEAAMQVIGSWQSGIISGESEEFHEKLGWFAFPAIEGKEEYASIAIGTVGDQFASFNCTDEKLEAAVQFCQLFSSDEMVATIIENGKIPPVEGGSDAVTDPSLVEVTNFVNSATAVQLWYDQYLPASVATVHLDTCQSLFGLSITPEEAAAEFQAAMQAELTQ